MLIDASTLLPARQSGQHGRDVGTMHFINETVQLHHELDRRADAIREQETKIVPLQQELAKVKDALRVKDKILLEDEQKDAVEIVALDKDKDVHLLGNNFALEAEKVKTKVQAETIIAQAHVIRELKRSEGGQRKEVYQRNKNITLEAEKVYTEVQAETIIAQAHMIRELNWGKTGTERKIVAQCKKFGELQARLKAQEVTIKAQKETSKEQGEIIVELERRLKKANLD
ncbi:hypothetical protein E8E11_011410 [Didymella keratinophila]|nr:hypothetical protein E8E11_011410 [Didymella keratinophila]